MNVNLSLRRIGAGLALAASAWLAEPMAAVAQTPCPPPNSPCGPPPLPPQAIPALPSIHGTTPSLPPAQGSTPSAQSSQPSAQPSQPGTQPNQQATPPSANSNAQTPTTPQTNDQANAANATNVDSGANNAFSQAPLAGTGGNSGSPNMLGDLLSGNRSVSFFVQRANGGLFINGTGSTNVSNPKVSENNSPQPRDRVSYRYNFFSNANSVTGQEGRGPFDPRLPGVNGFRDTSIFGFRGIARTLDYDRNLHTFGVEKTFLDRTASVELRVPFSTGLGSKLNLNYGNLTGIESATAFDENAIDFVARDAAGNSIPFVSPTPGVVSTATGNRSGQSFIVQNTPDQTLGRDDTEFGNMSLIFKGLLYRDCNFLLSAGVGVQIPTAQDARVRVVDYEGDVLLNDAEVRRQREFLIKNETWSASPFLAALYTPNDRVFAQAFIQLDCPVTSNRVIYNSTITDSVPTPPITTNNSTNGQGFASPYPAGTVLLDPYQAGGATVTGRANDQFLLHTDIGVGYWLYKNPCASWLTGLAPTAELHYTTTLNDADLVAFPDDDFGRDRGLVVPGNPAGTVALGVPPTQSTVGNTRNRMDILNLTVGATATIGDRLTIANGFGFPLRGGDNRTFDWEYQFQLNYYFGCTSSTRSPQFTPNLQ